MKQRTKSIKQNLVLQGGSWRPRKKSESKKDCIPKPNNQSSIKPPAKSCHKQEEQAKKHLQRTLNILSHRFNIRNGQGLNKQSTILNLSSSLYKIVKENVFLSDKRGLVEQKQNLCPNFISSKLVNKHNQPRIKDQILKSTSMALNVNGSGSKVNCRDSRKVILSEKQTTKQRATSAMANYSILEASSMCQQNSIIGNQQNSIIDNHQNSITGNEKKPFCSQDSIFVKRRSNSTLDSYFRQKFGTNAQDEQGVEKKLRVIKALKKSQQIVTKSNRSHVQSSMLLSSCDVNDKSIVMEKLKNKNSQKIR